MAYVLGTHNRARLDYVQKKHVSNAQNGPFSYNTAITTYLTSPALRIPMGCCVTYDKKKLRFKAFDINVLPRKDVLLPRAQRFPEHVARGADQNST
jgi:hypothetical protein